MDEAEQPIKNPDILEQIESEMHLQDKRFWKELRGMQMPTPLSIKIQSLLFRDGPSPPQSPVRLSGIISRYGLALIEVEATKYPRLHPNKRRWMIALTQRVENRVMNLIDQLESRDPLLSLDYHGLTRDDMLRVLQSDATWAIDMYSFGSSSEPKFSASVIEVVHSQSPESSKNPTDPNPSLVERRLKLLSEYKAANKSVPNKRIYEARNSGIYKPEFYEWMSGKLPDTSSITVTFERFLRDKKPPIPRKLKN
jgi:hypothetical protein